LKGSIHENQIPETGLQPRELGWLAPPDRCGIGLLGARPFASELGLDGATIHQFADRINATNESGSLHPRAPISAIPCRYLRELAEPENESVMNEFKRQIEDFIEANSRTIQATRILVDLHVSPDPVPAHFVKATKEVFSNFNPGEVVKEVVIAV
jgi:hypothetical protein